MAAMRATNFDRITPPTHTHPILAAMQFSTLTQRRGGATMNLKTNKILKPDAREVSPSSGRHVAVKGTADKGYVVGGEKDHSGKRIPTEYEKSMSPADTLRHKERLRGKTDNPAASLGSWVDKGNKTGKKRQVEVDASAVYQNRTKAERVGSSRGEKAIYDNSSGKDIRLDGK